MKTKEYIKNIIQRMVRLIAQNKPTLVVIGASTGGPKAIQTILEAMPKDINAVFLIAQHMPPVLPDHWRKDWTIYVI